MLQTSRIFCRCSEWKIWQIHFCTSCDLCISFFLWGTGIVSSQWWDQPTRILAEQIPLGVVFLVHLVAFGGVGKMSLIWSPRRTFTKKYNKQDLNKTCPGSAVAQMLAIFRPGKVRFTSEKNPLENSPLFRWLWPRIVCFYEIKSPPTHHPCIQVKSPGLFPRSTHSAQASVCWFFQDHQ